MTGQLAFALTDAERAQQARETAIAVAETHASRTWKERAYAAILACSVALPVFSSDDVIDILNQEGIGAGKSPSALGPLFRRAAFAGEIEKVHGGMVPTKFTQRHRDLQLWRRVREE